jgi:hypothetical protein
MNNLISKTIDAIEIHSETDLTLETNTQIRLNTPNLLINSIPFDEYIRKLIFDEECVFVSDIHMTPNTSISSDVNLTESMVSGSEFVVDNLYCANIDANTSYVNIDKHHCITLSAMNEIIFINKQGGSNIVYNNRDALTDCSLSNYIYNVINGVGNTDDLSPYQKTRDTHEFDVTNFGTYYTNKIITSNVVTTNSYVMPANEEPLFNISSRSAINLQIYGVDFADTDIYDTIGTKIKFGSSPTDTIDLKSYIHQYLDETGMFEFFVNIGNGASITMQYEDNSTYRGFRNTKYGNKFTYTITYKIYNEDEIDFSSSVDLDSYMLTSIQFPFQNVDDSVREGNSYDNRTFTFNNLTPGNFYRIYADIFNQKTNTIVRNVGPIEINIATIPHIDVLGITIQILNERHIEITFPVHQISLLSFPIIFFNMRLHLPNESNYIDDNDGINPSHDLKGPFNTVTKTFIFNVNSITGYGQSYIKKDVSHVFNIRSFQSGGFEMISSKIYVSDSDILNSKPIPPDNIRIEHNTGNTYTFTITPSLQTFFNKEDIIFGVKYENTYTSFENEFSNSSSITHNFSNEIIASTYYAVCKNIYNTLSDPGVRSITVKNFLLTTISITHNDDRTKTVHFNVSGHFDSYNFTLSGDNVGGNTIGVMNSVSVKSNELSIGSNKLFEISMYDTLDRRRNITSNYFNVYQPTVSVTAANNVFIYKIDSIRIFYILLSVSSDNEGTEFTINGTPTLETVHGNVNSNTITAQYNTKSLNKIYFEFDDVNNENNYDPVSQVSGEVQKYIIISIKDACGYTANIQSQQIVKINILFNEQGLYPSVTHGQNTPLQYSGNHREFKNHIVYATYSIISYSWYISNIELSDTDTIEVPNNLQDEASRTIYSEWVVKNNEGFTYSYKATTYDDIFDYETISNSRIQFSSFDTYGETNRKFEHVISNELTNDIFENYIWTLTYGGITIQSNTNEITLNNDEIGWLNCTFTHFNKYGFTKEHMITFYEQLSYQTFTNPSCDITSTNTITYSYYYENILYTHLDNFSSKFITEFEIKDSSQNIIQLPYVFDRVNERYGLYVKTRKYGFVSNFQSMGISRQQPSPIVINSVEDLSGDGKTKKIYFNMGSHGNPSGTHLPITIQVVLLSVPYWGRRLTLATYQFDRAADWAVDGIHRTAEITTYTQDEDNDVFSITYEFPNHLNKSYTYYAIKLVKSYNVYDSVYSDIFMDIDTSTIVPGPVTNVRAYNRLGPISVKFDQISNLYDYDSSDITYQVFIAISQYTNVGLLDPRPIVDDQFEFEFDLADFEIDLQDNFVYNIYIQNSIYDISSETWKSKKTSNISFTYISTNFDVPTGYTRPTNPQIEIDSLKTTSNNITIKINNIGQNIIPDSPDSPQITPTWTRMYYEEFSSGFSYITNGLEEYNYVEEDDDNGIHYVELDRPGDGWMDGNTSIDIPIPHDIQDIHGWASWGGVIDETAEPFVFNIVKKYPGVGYIISNIPRTKTKYRLPGASVISTVSLINNILKLRILNFQYADTEYPIPAEDPFEVRLYY